MKKIICKNENCRKVFEKRGCRRVYCSKECCDEWSRVDYTKKRKEAGVRDTEKLYTCQNRDCNNTYKQHLSGRFRSYCSDLCRRYEYTDVRRDKNDFKGYDEVCGYRWCNNMFYRHTRIKKYCSKKCGQDEAYAKIVELSNQPKECKREGCKFVFATHHRNRKYCSTECRVKANYKTGPNRKKSTELTHQISRTLKEYGMPVDMEDRRRGIRAELKIEIIEAQNALLSNLFTEDEYKEEMEGLAKKYDKTVEELDSYLKTLSFERKEFKYKNTSTYDMYHPTPYELEPQILPSIRY